MPYFIRQPYAASAKPVQPQQKAEAPDILALAAEVLAGETLSKGAGAFRLAAPLRPGTTGRMVLGVTAEGAAIGTNFSASDLTGPAGTIPARFIRFDPSQLALAPGQSADVAVLITAPPGTVPGVYSGRIIETGGSGFAAPLTVTIVA